jgi:predicted O-methyltransferase YrrM
VRRARRRVLDAAGIYRSGVPFRAVVFFDRAVRRTQSDPRGRYIMTKHGDYAFLLRLAKGRKRCVELGTGIGTTALGLAVADDEREVWSYDPFPRDLAPYMELVPESVSSRVHFVPERGDAPSSPPADVDFLFIDSSHARDEVVSEFRAWRPQLAPGAVVAFHDYSPVWPGVMQAVDEDLRLTGDVDADVFVWRNGD